MLDDYCCNIAFGDGLIRYFIKSNGKTEIMVCSNIASRLH